MLNILQEFQEMNWKLFSQRVYQKIKDVELSIKAMSLVYITLLSLIPLLIFSFYLITLFNFFGSLDRIIELSREVILTHLATGTGQTVIELLEAYVTEVDIAQLGVVSFISLIVIVIFMLAKIEKSFNLIWGVTEHRDLFKRFVSFWTFITLGTFLLALVLGFIVSIVTSYLDAGMINLSADNKFLFRLLLTLTYFILYIVAYYLIPNTKVEPIAAVVGGLVSGGLFTVTRSLYLMYTRSMITYYRIHRIYGSLSVIPLFLIWLYLVWLITLFGAVVCYIFQNRDNLNHIIDSEEISIRIKSLIPVVILTVVYKDFMSSETTGVSFNNLCSKLNLPPQIIKNNLQGLVEEDLLAITNQKRYIPLTKATNVSLWDICSSLLINNQLEVEELFFDKQIINTYSEVEKSLKEKLSRITMLDLIEQN
ncbi:YihY/virulence factor BrkB family protein [Natroniella sp. ANB-PHB2]|uniref:YihY/virulence factor BrkB family protein n=1 Tax=Natroniella sp. ANB-PHB2 TaxID=3384444 RepID=UPI0038D401BB